MTICLIFVIKEKIKKRSEDQDDLANTLKFKWLFLEKPMNSIIKSVIKKRIDEILVFTGSFIAKNYDLKDTIVLSSSPRGGSTWLAQILSTLPGYSVLWEPLGLRGVPEAQKIGFNWRTYIPPGTEWDEAELFLKKILSGQLLSLHTLWVCRLQRVFFTKAWVVKFCHANMLLKWLTEKFSIRKPVLLIRHPCAVVSSQMKVGDVFDIRTPHIDPRFIKDYPQFESTLTKLNTWEEALAGTWCQEYFATLSLPKPHPWLLVTYEKLVRNGKEEIERIFSTLGFNTPKAAIDQLKIPSKTTKRKSSIVTGGDQLAVWKKKLTRDQIKRILDVVSAFGLDFYFDALEPDYNRLYSENPVRI